MFRKSIHASLISIILTASCDTPPCVNEVKNRIQSPDGNYYAVVFQRNCGTTSGNNFQISVLRQDESSGDRQDLLEDGGNTFVIDYPQERYYSASGIPKITARWENASHLLIEYSEGPRIFTQATVIKGVNVRYLASRVPESARE
jgi:hypothetical protein